MTEAGVHALFKTWLKFYSIPFLHSRTDKRTTTHRGDPDFLLAWNGKCLFIEVKVNKNILSDVQEKRIAQLRKAGNRVCICTSVNECIAAAYTLVDKTPK